jgi:hypothetical protein
MEASLDGVRRKLNRAETRLAALTTELMTFDQAETMSADNEIDPDDGAELFRLHKLREPDPEWEITVGEVAYQVRSVLDQLVTQLAILNGGDADEHGRGFPIFIDKDAYWRIPRRKGSLSKRDELLQGVAEAHRNIIDAMQPYNFGDPIATANHPLAMLNDVCNWDKHRYGHPTAFVMRAATLTQIHPILGKVHSIYYLQDGRGTYAGIPMETGDTVRIGGDRPTFKPPLDLPVDSVTFAVGVRFGRRRIFAGDLAEIVDFVKLRVVAPFEPFFPM